MAEKTYLGDSVYAEKDDDGGVWLETNNGLPDDPSNKIYLGVLELEALEVFMERE